MPKVLTWGIIRRCFLSYCGLAAGLVLLAACGGSSPAQVAKSGPAVAANQPAATAVASGSSQAAPGGDTVSLEVDTASGAKEFKYVQTALEAPAGSKITLNFHNKTDLKDEVGHNWVLVKPGQEDSVIANAVAAGDDQDWLKADDPGIIAHTRLIEGGESDSITFDAPPPGVYTFLCTFPDHYAAGHKGTLTIK